MSSTCAKAAPPSESRIEEDRTLVAIISTDITDRVGDRLHVDGVELDDYRKNPVVLFGHDAKSVIGRALWIKVAGGKLLAKVQFANTPLATEVWQLYRDGFLSAWSVGFKATSATPIFDDLGEGPSLDIRAWTLLEFSAVAVPANPEALTIAVADGRVEETPIVKAMLPPLRTEQVVIGGVFSPAFSLPPGPEEEWTEEHGYTFSAKAGGAVTGDPAPPYAPVFIANLNTKGEPPPAPSLLEQLGALLEVAGNTDDEVDFDFSLIDVPDAQET